MSANTTSSTRPPDTVAIYPRYMWQCPLCRGMNFSTPCVFEPSAEARVGQPVDPQMYTAPDGVECGGCAGVFEALFIADEWEGEKL